MITEWQNIQKIDEISVSNNDNVKYKLSENDVVELYYSEPRLSVLIDLNVIRWIDNHLVVNLKDFITPKRNHLSAKAKRNLSACCIGILYSNVDKNTSNIISTLDILLQSASFSENGTVPNRHQTDDEIHKESSKIESEISRVNSIMNQLPGGFSGSLKAHIERKGYTEELLSQESWVSMSTIKQYRQKEEKEKTFKTVTALCIGMHLHPWLTEDLLRKAGITPKATQQDGAFRYLYTFHYKDSIEDCNIYLRSVGLPEFKMREKSA